ncbi:zinc ribbon domain-containing protein [Paraburkholderia mimosarum]|uniref:zinc ribbon domain-containing protein n=1 Tax=Paraburkholderia mimosarum TaxID=312026 RepID=UPI0009DE037E
MRAVHLSQYATTPSLPVETGAKRCAATQYASLCQLEYKLDWSGGWLIAVPPQNTSRTCPCCGPICAFNRHTLRRWA